MSTNLKHFDQFGPAWNRQLVMVFAGQHETHIHTGEDYDTRTLASLFTLEPSDSPKGAGLAFIPSSYHDYDGREHKAQRERGEFVTLTGDVDKGDHALERVETLIRAFAGDAAWLIYSSAHARPNNRRWRIILPLEEPVSYAVWHDAQNAFYAFMESAGVKMDWALDRAAQPVYLPNVPAKHDQSGTPLRGDDGKPLYYERISSGTNAPGLRLDNGALAAGLATIARQRASDDAERERIRVEAERRRAARPHTDNTAVIDDFNQGTSIETLLTLYRYEQSLRHSEDWRSPHQQGETYATRIIGDKWISLSSSDAGAGLGSRHAAGCYGDAYDLFVHFEHGGDHKAAFRAIYAERQSSLNSSSSGSESHGQDAISTGDDKTTSYDTPLPLIWARDVTPVLTSNWIVKRVIPSDGFVSIIGEPGCGKSFFALDLACHIAAGIEWRGRKVQPGLVVYLAAEGQRGQMNRVEAWKREHGIADMPLALIPTAVNLRDSATDLPKLIHTIEAAVAQSGLPLSMLIVDTLNRSFGGGDENGEDMGQYVGNSDKLRQHFQCTTGHVHHIPKNGDLTERGHGSLRGAIDTSLGVTSDPETGVRTLICLKQKDGEDGWKMQFKLRRIVLGSDEDGEDVTTCVIDPATEDAAVSAKTRGPNLSATQRQVYNELLATMEAAPLGVPRDIPEDQIDRSRIGKVCSRKLWRDRWIAVAGSDRAEDVAGATFRRAVTDLANKGLVGLWNDHAWPTFQ